MATLRAALTFDTNPYERTMASPRLAILARVTPPLNGLSPRTRCSSDRGAASAASAAAASATTVTSTTSTTGAVAGAGSSAPSSATANSARGRRCTAAARARRGRAAAAEPCHGRRATAAD